MKEKAWQRNRIWERIKDKKGFNLAELMIVVAIIAVLSAVAFISVQRYQRSLGQLERDAIAKEIFVAAQNHIVTAREQGYLANSDYGTPGTYDDDIAKKVYYFVVYKGSIQDRGDKVFELMLPFGALDETVRAGGSYLIRYQPETATVLDVFYCTTSGSPAGFNYEQPLTEYNTLMESYAGADKKGARRSVGSGNYILGWYGGPDAADLPSVELKAPDIEIYNGETLKVTVKNNSVGVDSLCLRLLITGEQSGVKHYLDYKALSDGQEEFVLDALTDESLHFCNQTFDDSAAGSFIPGENLRIQAVAYSTAALSNVAYSAEKTTNSLFADITGTGAVPDTAMIGNFRHLENLHQSISNLNRINTVSSDPNYEKLSITAAVQQTDLDWTGDNGGYWKNLIIVDADGTVAAAQGKYVPVEPDYSLAYNGQSHSISHVDISADMAGLFNSTVNGTLQQIENLELIDFSVIGANTAGTLAGTLTGTAVANVLARDKANTVPSVTGGTSGGLIGSLSGGSVTRSAAAVLVGGSGTGTAGGLIGSAANGSGISGCYSGGRTENGEYKGYNISAAGAAGGLVGNAGSISIDHCYSTCSVSGGTAGGFVGTASETRITDSYCTGLVSGATAFLGAGNLANTSVRNQYYSIVNWTVNDKKETVYKEPGDDSVTALDGATAAYDVFPSIPWDPASPYDATLLQRYQGRYNLRTVSQLGISVSEGDFVATHYGDWPSPETFVINAG